MVHAEKGRSHLFVAITVPNFCLSPFLSSFPARLLLRLSARQTPSGCCKSLVLIIGKVWKWVDCKTVVFICERERRSQYSPRGKMGTFSGGGYHTPHPKHMFRPRLYHSESIQRVLHNPQTIFLFAAINYFTLVRVIQLN